MYLDLSKPGVIRAMGVYKRGGGITQILRYSCTDNFENTVILYVVSI
jgi:hypothetical protein